MATDLPAAIYSLYRVNIVGSIGSGESTLGKLIAKKVGYPYIEGDEIYWKLNWTESAEEELFTNLELSLKGKICILDGNYSKT